MDATPDNVEAPPGALARPPEGDGASAEPTAARRRAPYRRSTPEMAPSWWAVAALAALLTSGSALWLLVLHDATRRGHVANLAAGSIFFGVGLAAVVAAWLGTRAWRRFLGLLLTRVDAAGLLGEAAFVAAVGSLASAIVAASPLRALLFESQGEATGHGAVALFAATLSHGLLAFAVHVAVGRLRHAHAARPVVVVTHAGQRTLLLGHERSISARARALGLHTLGDLKHALKTQWPTWWTGEAYHCPLCDLDFADPRGAVDHAVAEQHPVLRMD